MNNNIINYIKTLSNNEKIQKLLFETIGNILLKQNNLDFFIPENELKIIHIRDWISSVVENNEQWKTPRVLTINALNNAADKYFEKQNNKLQIIELNNKEEKLITDLGDYYVVQMLTPKALDNESKQMQHCIGYGSYDEKLNNDDYQYLSLRDKFNKAHVTLEIFKNNIQQLQGKQNKIPDKKYLNQILNWIYENKYKINLDRYNLIINKLDNKIYSIYDLPENCEIDGDLYIDLDIKKIPKNLKVNGSIYFDIDYDFSSDILTNDYFKDAKIDIYDLLSFLIQNGYEIDLKKYDLTFNKLDNKIYSIYNLPDNCEIDGNLGLYRSDITKLPENLTVKGNLYLECYNIKELPQSLKVDGFINFYNIKLDFNSLPDNLFIDHKINIYDLLSFLIQNGYKINLKEYELIFNKVNNKIYSVYNIPENCEIDQNFIFLPMKKLPKNLIINGNINLEYCEIEEISTNTIINGNLILENSKIKILSNNLTVHGDLDLSYTEITKLPKNLFIGGNLIMNQTQITEIPDDIKINGSIFARRSKINKLPDNLIIHGDLDLSICSDLTELPKNLFINGNLYIDETNITEIPNDIKIGQSLSVMYSKVEKLPDNFILNQDLYLGHSKLKKLPENIMIGNILYLDNVNITELPDNLYCKILELPITKISLLKDSMNFENINIYNYEAEQPYIEYTKEEFFKKYNNIRYI